MNTIDRKYILGTLIIVLILVSLEITAYSLTDNILSSSIIYEERKITAELKFLSPTNEYSDSKIMHISIIDETTNEYIENTIFFLTITNDDKDIFRNYFFINNEDLVVNVITDTNDKIRIEGERQYTFDAYVMSPSSELKLKGPFLLPDENYIIKLRLKTIDNIENIVSRLDPFEFIINSNDLNIQNDVNFKVTDQNNSPSVNFLEFEANQNANLNNFGFRGPDIDPKNVENNSRIILIGGSTMYGAGATSDQSTIAGYLQEIIDRNLPTKNFEIINAGIQGINSDAELRVIKEDILQLEPKFIIIFDGWNDLQDNHSSAKISKNWENMCEFGMTNNIQTIIILQPIAGFGNKTLTEKEKYNALNAVDNSNEKLNSKIFQYQEYENKLIELSDRCSTSSFRGVFDNVIQEVYWDEGHLNDYGNFMIADGFFESYVQKFVIDGSDSLSIDTGKDSKLNKIPITIQDILANYKTPDFLKQKIINLFT